MHSAVRIALQLILYGAFAVSLAWFATNPPYQYGDATMASIKVSLSHAADRVEPCVQLTPEQNGLLQSSQQWLLIPPAQQPATTAPPLPC